MYLYYRFYGNMLKIQLCAIIVGYMGTDNIGSLLVYDALRTLTNPSNVPWRVFRL